MLEHVFGRYPVTALKYTSRLILTCEGPTLKIWSRQDRQLLQTLRVFASQAVHGIACKESDTTIVVLWAGSIVTALAIKHDETLSFTTLVDSLQCPDWILDGIFASSNCSVTCRLRYQLYLVTAHDALLAVSIDPQSPAIVQLTPQSTCLLYTARVTLDGSRRVLVASGTIFGDIVVWSARLDRSTAIRTTHHVLSGHEGSVFGVDISEPVTLTDDVVDPCRLIASCSDDRTVRVWAITADTSKRPSSQTMTVRETGFGVTMPEMPTDIAEASSVATAWGHASRIWSVHIVHVNGQPLPHVITHGEDATTIIWQISPSETVKTRNHCLTALRQITQHRGKHIWSSDVAHCGNDHLLVATGGSDGAVTTIDLRLPILPSDADVVVWSLPPAPRLEHTRETVMGRARSYTFLTATMLIVVLDSGDIFEIDTSRQPVQTYPRWRACHEHLKGYSVAASAPGSDLVFLSGRDGSLFLSRGEEDFVSVAKGHGKTAALFARIEKEQNFCLMTFVGIDGALLHICSPAASRNLQLALPCDFIVSSFAALDDSAGCLVLLGGRDGGILAYRLHNGSMQRAPVRGWTERPDAITDMVFHNPRYTGVSHMLTSCRNGTVSMYIVRMSDSELSLELCHHLPIRGMTTVEQLVVAPQEGRILACGFNSKHFISKDILTYTDVLRSVCGGANRAWAFHASPDSRGGSFAWTKSSQLCTQAALAKDYHLLQRGGQGREIKAIAIGPSHTVSGRLVATGAEDTDIDLARLENDENGIPQLRSICCIQKHNTGIQQLQWSDDGRFLFSCGGVEELFVWRVSATPLLQVGVYCDSQAPIDSNAADLRIMDLSVRRQAGAAEDSFIISAVKSDGSIVVYSYMSTEAKKQWTRLYASTLSTCCLTNCIDMSREKTLSFLVAGTDGHAALISEQESESHGQMTVGHRFRIHQSAVHCVDLHDLDGRESILITGGDDNALGLTRIRRRSASAPTLVHTLVIPRAHAAAITGVCVIRVSSPQADGTLMMQVGSTGLDQRVKIWEVTIEPGKMGTELFSKVRNTHDEFTAVADASAMEWYEDEHGTGAIAICGIGIDLSRVMVLGR